MIGYNVDGGAGPFEVVSPPFEGVVDSHKLFVVDVVIGKYWGCGKCLFKFLEGFSAVVGEIPRDIFSGEPREWYCNFRVEIGRAHV